jgi:hypothetical protein
MGDKRGSYRVVVRRPGGNNPLGRPRRRLENIIKMDLYKVEWEGTDFIDLTCDKVS